MRPLFVALMALLAGCATAAPPSLQIVPPSYKNNSPPPTSGHVHDYVDYALKQHPQLKIQHARWLEQRAKIELAAKWPDPMLMYSFAPLPIETRQGPQRHIVKINQNIPWPSKLSIGSDAQRAMTRAEKTRYDALFLTLQHNIQTHYWTLWVLHTTVSIMKQQLKLLGTLEQSIKASVQTNAQPALALHQVAQLKTELHDAIKTIQSQQRVSTHRFLAAIGTNTLNPQTIKLSEQPHFPKKLPELSTLIQASEGHPNLVQFQHLFKAQQQKYKQAQLQQRPNFVLGAQWSLISEQDNMPQSGRDALMISVGISIPIWSKANHAAVDAQQARLVQTQSKLELARLEQRKKITTTYTMLQNIVRRLKLLETTRIQQAQTNYQLSLAGYSTQKVEIASVINALKALFLIEREHAMLIGQGALLWSRLNILAGFPLKAGGRS